MTRIAIVEKQKCKNGIDCPFICGKDCPVNRDQKDCITVGENNKAVISEELCIGCGICIKECPHDAIKIINLPENLKTDPIHRYGVNTFALFSLPTPMFGKVVGILGVNGIGKTTALKLLAGVIKPNFGTAKDADWQEVVDFFKGTEAQIFFEKVRDGSIKIAYKPQAVDLIPKTAKGTVRDLLMKVDEKNIFDETVDKLELRNILDTEIQNISGGELQKVAIAATAMKNANLYIFDEPTSYLDIKQRLKMARFVRDLATPEASVLVVEHDLIILDHTADLVHLMYGNEGVFGVVSMLKPTKAGINTYLLGYMMQENMRFRNYKITFGASAQEKTVSNKELISWTDIEKKLGNFKLNAKKGNIFRSEVIGVLGENGIGKTTFVKILANVLKPDSGSINGSVKVSYKPQYLEKSDELVAVILADAQHKFENELMRPLGLRSLLLRKVSELSGGELQRVAIALCLSRDADLFLIDEPSAFLDVEQRLIVSKVIRDFIERTGKSAMVVDHDLIFLDYLSNRLLVFTGEPAVSGDANGPFVMEQGMNFFLKDLGITLRRDEESKRPRINKLGSVLDREQKSSERYYY